MGDILRYFQTYGDISGHIILKRLGMGFEVVKVYFPFFINDHAGETKLNLFTFWMYSYAFTNTSTNLFITSVSKAFEQISGALKTIQKLMPGVTFLMRDSSSVLVSFESNGSVSCVSESSVSFHFLFLTFFVYSLYYFNLSKTFAQHIYYIYH